MSYQATVITVMIASPSDVMEERDIIRQALYEWNAINSKEKHIVLLPVSWETHTAPEFGGRPQEIINKQILKDCDILIGVFWTRIGSPTGKEISGTVEEIKEHYNNNKRLMLYFSEKEVKLKDVDVHQCDAVKDFKKWCLNNGLICTYTSIIEFKEFIKNHIQIEIAKVLPSINRIENKPINGDDLSPNIKISGEASQLLQEAYSSNDGMIYCHNYIGGCRLQTNNKQFLENSTAREIAKWEGAINQLLELGFISYINGKHQVFKVTQKGYEFVDALENKEI